MKYNTKSLILYILVGTVVSRILQGHTNHKPKHVYNEVFSVGS